MNGDYHGLTAPARQGGSPGLTERRGDKATKGKGESFHGQSDQPVPGLCRNQVQYPLDSTSITYSRNFERSTASALS